ncbi:MAG: hypothetical protein ABI906_05545 [Pseudomonadota bacterium]
MLKSVWNSIMDPDRNALLRMPKIVRFQLMIVLSVVWSAIFCVSASILVWFPGYVLAHVALLLIGIFGTSWLFRNAEAAAAGKPPADG